MAIGAVPGGGGSVADFSADAAKLHTDVAKVREDEDSGASALQFLADEAQVQKDASQLHGDIARIGVGNKAFIDTLSPQDALQFIQAVISIGQDLTNLANLVRSATPNSPKLPFPSNPAAMATFQRERGAGWLAPNPMMSVFAALRQALQEEAYSEMVAGLGVAKGMEATMQLGQAEAQADIAIGQDEYAKGLATGAMEIASGAAMMMMAAKNASDMAGAGAGGVGAAEGEGAEGGADVSESADEAEAPSSEETARQEENFESIVGPQGEIEGGHEEGMDAPSMKDPNKPDELAPPPPEDSAETETTQETEDDAQASAAKKKDEQAAIDKKDRLEKAYKYNEIRTMKAQGLAQMMGGVEKMVEGAFQQEIQNEQAALAIIHARQDVNRTYTQFMSQDESAFAEQISAASSLLTNLSASMAAAFHWSNSSSGA